MPRTAVIKPTPRQREILAWIETFVAEHSLPPTMREIGAHFDLQVSTVHELMSALETKGLLVRADRGSRALVPAKAARRHHCACTEVPLVGIIAAGSPIEAIEDRHAQVTVRKDLLHGERGYALKVKGDSMIEAGILDGDTVIVREQADAKDGDIVVALIGSDATLKRFYRERGGVRLEPANRRFHPIRIHTGDFRIQGVVVGVERILASVEP